MDPFFIVGKRVELTRLREASQLSGSWLADDLPHPRYGPQNNAGNDIGDSAVNGERTNEPIRLIDPEEWGEDDWPRLLTMQESVVAHLVVLDDTSTLNDATERAKRLLDLLAQHMIGRDRTVRHVLLLLQTTTSSTMTQADLDEIVELTLPDNRGQQNADSVWSAVYAMTSRLEPIGDTGFTAAKVWPVAVGQLLMHWMHELPPVVASSGSHNRFFAWRHLTFSPQGTQSQDTQLRGSEAIDQDGKQWEQLVAKCFQQVWRGVFADRSGQRPDLRLADGPMALTPYDFKPQPGDRPYQKWTDYHSQELLEQRLTPHLWRSATQQTGQQLRQQSSQYARDSFDRGRQATEGYWRLVHTDPSALIWPLVADGQEKAAQDSLAQLGEAAAQFEENVVDHHRCGEEFQRTQSGWIEWPMRIVAIVAVCFAVGYAALLTVYYLLDSLWMAAGCLLATVIGSIAAAFLSKDLESKAGRRGQFTLDAGLQSLDQEVQQRYVAAADLFALGTQRNTLVQRRAQIGHAESKRRALHHQIQQWQSDIDLGDKPAKRGASHLDLADVFAQATTLPLPIDMRPVDQEAAVAPFIKKEVETFRERVWQPICRGTDPFARGAMDRDQMRRRIQAYFERFAARLISFAGLMAIAQLQQSRISGWYQDLTSHLQLDRYLSGASCHFPSGTTPPSHLRPEIQLVFQSGFEKLGCDSRLDDFRKDHVSDGSHWLGDVPALGYMHERIPVHLTVEDGQLRVKSWEEGTLDAHLGGQPSPGGSIR
ncbi:hypothetical protein [Stieleria varia]|uniref:Uncharacterized protein n=1 Tax=Stieleria varia TaxID=2528005 RepID=A0A5C5ZPS4_9BACT|nr:hypothetical protein [Stieleria varia]TWT89484.1 hypothetical protein Pla52n_67720 [Stieleria varia]